MYIKKKSFYEVCFNIFNIIFLTAAAVVTFYPFWHELCVSLSSPEYSTLGGLFLAPKEFNLLSYKKVLSTQLIWSAYYNTIFTTVVATILGVMVTALTAYPLSRKNLSGSKQFTGFVLFTMLFSGGMIPTYLVVKQLGLVDSLWALIIPGLMPAFNVIIMKNFFMSIPEELIESAYMDGANPLVVFFKIILPLSTPVLATVSLWAAVGTWNDFLSAVIYINSTPKQTLPLLVRSIIQGQQIARATAEVQDISTNSIIGATIIISILPIVCLYPFLQKYFVKGVMIGAVKG